MDWIYAMRALEIVVRGMRESGSIDAEACKHMADLLRAEAATAEVRGKETIAELFRDLAKAAKGGE